MRGGLELKIGELAARAGVSADAVRYYERRRLIPRAGRSRGGFRLFSPGAVARIRFIKQAQELGFTLDEIRELQTSGGAAKCRRVRDLLKAKLDELDARMKVMRSFRQSLSDHLAECERALRAEADEAECPVLEEPVHPAAHERRNRR